MESRTGGCGSWWYDKAQNASAARSKVLLSPRGTPVASSSCVQQPGCCSLPAAQSFANGDRIALSSTLNKMHKDARAPPSWHSAVRRAAGTSSAQLCAAVLATDACLPTAKAMIILSLPDSAYHPKHILKLIDRPMLPMSCSVPCNLSHLRFGAANIALSASAS